MGISMIFRGGKWYANRKIDGTMVIRQDKLCVFMSRAENTIMVLEQGGDYMTLWEWMLKYGGCSNNSDVYKAFDCESGNFGIVDNFEFEKKKQKPSRFVSELQVSTSVHRDSNLKEWFYSMFGKERTDYVFSIYKVGATHDGGTQYWYSLNTGEICHDNIISYGDNGHRLKTSPASRKCLIRNGYTNRGYFGWHLVKEGRRVFVVESEKTALMCALFFGSGTWIACGGNNNLHSVKCDWTLISDIDAWELWNKKYKGQCPKWWESYPDWPHGDKDDIGDYIEWKIKNLKQ